MEDNIRITVTIELSPETYSHISNVENLGDLLKLECEKKVYQFVCEDLGIKTPQKCSSCGSMFGHAQQCKLNKKD